MRGDFYPEREEPSSSFVMPDARLTTLSSPVDIPLAGPAKETVSPDIIHTILVKNIAAQPERRPWRNYVAVEN